MNEINFDESVLDCHYHESDSHDNNDNEVIESTSTETEGPGPPPVKKVKLNISSVHKHFKPMPNLYNPKSKTFCNGSFCESCDTVFYSSVATNLKRHLKQKHPAIFSQVESKF